MTGYLPAGARPPGRRGTEARNKCLGDAGKERIGLDSKNRFFAHLPDLILVTLAAVVAAAVILVDRSPRVVVVAVQQLAPFDVIATDLQVRYAADDQRRNGRRACLLGVTPRYKLEPAR
jgi:hypothetical protein